MGKRIISALLALVMLVGMLPVTALAAGTTVASGTCGKKLTWKLDSEGTLTISGVGAMKDYQNNDDRPWGSGAMCDKITSVVIHDGVSSIGRRAFAGCNNLTNITIPDSVTSIGDDSFYYCTGLASIEIPDSVTSIGDDAFYHCTVLTSIEIPDSVTSIGVGAFADCKGLTAIYVDPDNMHYSSDEKGALYNKDKTLLVQVPGVVSGEYTISDSVAVIGDYALAYCDNLTSITIPEGIVGIGNHAFSYCRKLTAVTIPDGVTTIGDYAFQYCDSLTSVTIPDSVTTIGKGAFNYCTRLTAVTIPDGVTTIGDHAFNQCHSLISVTIPEGVTTIGNSAFQYCYSLTAVTIPDGVTTIDVAAFSNCTSLKSVTIPEGVTTIAPSAFSSCTSLKSVTIPDGVTTISTYAFLNCQSLTSITIPDGVTTIGYRAFDGCTSLKSVTIPDSVTTIEYGAFMSCRSLTSVTIPDSVATIDDYAFNYCDRLTSVTIPDSVTTIGDYAFRNCSRLVSVTFCGDAPSIEDNAFKNVTATVYYPANNRTWTEKVRKNYGGNLTWESYQPDLTPNDKGEIYFYSFEHLKQIAATNYDVMVNVKYVGMNPLIISEDLTIPYNMILNLDECKKVIVPENVTFNVQCQLLVDSLEVNGTMNTQAMFNVESGLAVNGTLTVFEIRAKSDTVISGREKISFYNEYGKLYRHYTISEEKAFREAVAVASASTNDREIFTLYVNPKNQIQLGSSLDIPANCEVQIDGAGMKISKGAALTLDGEFLDLYAPLTVEGTLRNNSRVGCFHDYNGHLTFASNRACVGSGVLRIYSEVLTDPQEAVPGLDLSKFHVTREEGYWEIKMNHAAWLEDILHDEHKTHKEKVDDVRDMDAEELKHSMEKDKYVRDMIENLENDAAGGKAGKKVRHEIPGINHEEIIIVGANLNSKEDETLDVTLVIDKVEEVHEITGNYETSTAVQFSMTLENVKDPKNLEVPVVVTLPVPEGLDPEKIVILHYHEDGTYDVITPEVRIVGGKTYARIVLTSFSDFAILEKLAALLGDVDFSEEVNVDDVLALLWYVLFPDEYPIDDVNVDFDNSGDVNVDDVLTLLWYVLFPDEYPLG